MSARIYDSIMETAEGALGLQNAVAAQLLEITKQQRQAIARIEKELSVERSRSNGLREDLADARADVDNLEAKVTEFRGLLCETHDLLSGDREMSDDEQAEFLQRLLSAIDEEVVIWQ